MRQLTPTKTSFIKTLGSCLQKHPSNTGETHFSACPGPLSSRKSWLIPSTEHYRSPWETLKVKNVTPACPYSLLLTPCMYSRDSPRGGDGDGRWGSTPLPPPQIIPGGDIDPSSLLKFGNGLYAYFQNFFIKVQLPRSRSVQVGLPITLSKIILGGGPISINNIACMM